MLTLLRTADAGPFHPTDIRLLTFALDAACDWFSEARLMETNIRSGAGGLAACPVVDDVAYYIVNRDLELILSWSNENRHRCSAEPGVADTRLPALLTDAVRRLTAGWTDDPTTQQPGMAFPTPFLTLRTRPMTGLHGRFVSVAVERSKPADSLIHAAAHFRLSPRELQVFALLARGSRLVDIAENLEISASTVQDHIKRLVEKTRAANRSEMIANVFRHNAAGRAATRIAYPPGKSRRRNSGTAKGVR
jgi:DNA-binding CsgD family transcriptional regulator